MPGIQWVLEQDCSLETETPVHWVLQLEYVVWLQIQLDPCMSVLSLSLEFTSEGQVILCIYLRQQEDFAALLKQLFCYLQSLQSS